MLMPQDDSTTISLITVHFLLRITGATSFPAFFRSFPTVSSALAAVACHRIVVAPSPKFHIGLKASKTPRLKNCAWYEEI